MQIRHLMRSFNKRRYGEHKRQERRQALGVMKGSKPEMFLKLLLWVLLLKLASSDGHDFIFNGFQGANLSLDGVAAITSDGLLMLTNITKQARGHAFYSIPIHFKNSSSGKAFSFSSTFVFAIVSELPWLIGHGITFAITPSKNLSEATGSQYLGLFNLTSNGNSANHIVAAELDTIDNPEFGDINDNHVGIDVNSLRSIQSYPAGYFTNGSGVFQNLSLGSGEPMQAWVEYDGLKMQLNVTISPIGEFKPSIPLISSVVNLPDIVLDAMYVGFSSSVGSCLTNHYILGWSFKLNGEAQALNLSGLPSLPQRGSTNSNKALVIWLPSVGVFLLVVITSVVILVIRKNKFSEILEDWELDYGPHRFSYKDLYEATKRFSNDELLGIGGFGRVYKGILPSSKMEVAVKRVSHDSRQGMREFVAEIVSIGHLRHRNLVQLLGYCRRKGEMLLVYDFMPNGSLDKFLFDQSRATLSWSQRFRIIKGVASGLLYLHEEWEQVIVHRDIKASNVLLDSELNGRLGDFGLARLYDHGTDHQSTHVVGTMGYLAPEFTMTGKATKATDVYAFGTFLLEVVCGRRPIKLQAAEEELILVDWVQEKWKTAAILEVTDPKLGCNYAVKEVDLVLRLGLLCCQALPTTRPSMRQVMQFLDGDLPLPELSSKHFDASFLSLMHNEAVDGYITSYNYSNTTCSLLSGR